MKASTSLALIVSAVAIISVNGGSLRAAVLRPRVVGEIWEGINITASVLQVYDAISQPPCNSTDSCVQLSTVVPTCLNNQGTADCWCTLHDPIHYCAICMSSSINPDQIQAATEGHTDYHRGCFAWQAYLDASATGSLFTSQPTTTSDASPSIASGHVQVSIGVIFAICITGVCVITIAIAPTFLIARCLKNQAMRAASSAGATKEKGNVAMGDPVRVTSYYTDTDMGDRTPNTPPLPCENQPMLTPPPSGSQPMSLQPVYSSGAIAGSVSESGARPDTPAHQPDMRQGSEFGGSSNNGKPLMQGQYQVTNDLGSQRAGLGSPPPPWSQQQPQP